jgi:predicted DNA-binding antitoxin AbrB/MazE fold protein
MKQAIEAVYENGTFRPLMPGGVEIAEGQRVRLLIDDANEPEAIRLATSVYEGLSSDEIDEIEKIALDRARFFSARNAD